MKPNKKPQTDGETAESLLTPSSPKTAQRGSNEEMIWDTVIGITQTNTSSSQFKNRSAAPFVVLAQNDLRHGQEFEEAFKKAYAVREEKYPPPPPPTYPPTYPANNPSFLHRKFLSGGLVDQIVDGLFHNSWKTTVCIRRPKAWFYLFISLPAYLVSWPWYNRTGWLGVKHQSIHLFSANCIPPTVEWESIWGTWWFRGHFIFLTTLRTSPTRLFQTDTSHCRAVLLQILLQVLLQPNSSGSHGWRQKSRIF